MSAETCEDCPHLIAEHGPTGCQWCICYFRVVPMVPIDEAAEGAFYDDATSPVSAREETR